MLADFGYQIQGKYALITGGSHGIGLAVAENLASHGVNVAICSRSSERLQSAKARLIRHPVEVITIETDVLQENAADAIFNKVIESWPGIDILVNNVGGGGRWGDPMIQNTKDEVWEQVFRKNALIAALLTKRALPHMLNSGWGRVIAITSIYGKEGGGRPWFNMAKSAEVSMIKTLSLTKYLVRSGITFNSVAPGLIYIPGTSFEDEKKRDPLEFEKQILDEIPVGRMGTPEEVARLVTFLCSKLAAFINGAQISIDGGQSKAF